MVLVDPAKATKVACDLEPCKAAEREDPARGGPGAGGRYQEMSPDGKRAAFIRDWNLWVRDVATGQETQLTTDGVKDFGYATDNAGWARSDRPILLWSPDSKKIATFQQDQRGVGEMYLVDTIVGHPKLQAWKYPLPGDCSRHDDPARRHRRRERQGGPPADAAGPASLDAVRRHRLPRRLGRRAVEPGRLERGVRLHRRAITSASSCASPTRPPARPRGPRREGRDVLRVGQRRGQLARTLPASNEVIWFSERDNWGHLYLYDLKTGTLKNADHDGRMAT